MGGVILSILAWIFGKLFGKPTDPSQEAQASAKAASAQASADTNATALKAETAIAQAEADAPRDQAGVVGELDKGTF